MRVYLRNRQRSKRLNPKRIKRDLSRALRLLGFQRAELSVVFVGGPGMRKLNSLYRDIDRVTDVLSFPQFPAGKAEPAAIGKSGANIPIGDIVICIPVAEKQAGEYGTGFYHELLRLLLHGLLHLAGYDHEINAYHKRKMEKKEKELLNALA